MLCFSCIDQSERGIKQCNGRYDSIVEPGCQPYIWPCQKISGVGMRVNQLNVGTDTKTKDDVTVTVNTAIQWSVDAAKVELYYFKMTNPSQQISSYVDDIIRSQLPIRELDAAFAEKDEMGRQTESELRKQLNESFGISVLKVLITDLRPDPRVMHAMNEINAAKREREAAKERAEAAKILTVMNAEAEKDARQLSGKGLALMRREIASGFKNSIVDLTGEEHGANLTADNVVHMMLVTQYLDVLKDFAHSGRSSMVVPHGAGFVQDLEQQVRTGFWTAQEMPHGGPPVAKQPGVL